MNIKLSPIRTDNPLKIEKLGDKLIINDEEFDFSPLEDGDTLPSEAIESNYIIGDVERIEGKLYLTILAPHGRDASEEERFPEPIEDVQDGIIINYEGPKEDVIEEEEVQDEQD